MRLRTATSVLLATAALLAPAASAAAQVAPVPGDGVLVTGLTANGRLVTVVLDSPDRPLDSRLLRGVGAGQRVLGMDFRPATGGLYVLTRDAAGVGRVLLVDRVTATVLSTTPLTTADAQPVVLTGSGFGVDFNPVVDRLRVTSDSGQNLRINVLDGVTTVDTALAFVAGGPTGAARVSASAYTNNDNDAATGTTLYGVDHARDLLVTQAPPNDGVLNVVGRLGRNARASAGLDVYSGGAGDLAVLSTGVGKQSEVAVIDLATGGVVPRTGGRIPVAGLIDVAAPTDQ